WKLDIAAAGGISFAFAICIYLIVKPRITKASQQLEQSKDSINTLFTLPLIFSASLLSFAHGANDVANAVGPLAAINDAIFSGGMVAKANIPLWIMLVGALGISTGLALYGPKLIRTIGSDITELDKMRAFCIAMSAAVTVIIASQLGLPVSSTHIAVGAVFGVGFLRELLKYNDVKRIEEIKAHHELNDPEKVAAFLQIFSAASVESKKRMLKELRQEASSMQLNKKTRKSLKKVYRQELVKRSHAYKIAVAWVTTVPLSAILAGLMFFMIRGMLLP
ncbi:MAG: inorganic phosphate transporter, partial [Gammaproteobacteria bacterium]